ncbi:MAG: hypothetical protein MJ228_04150 [Bacilli bacterium]|nr:hypothetical protein [Bacilli bacterium]
MKESLKTFVNSVGSNGLMLLELPTGFGKTYNVQEYVFDYLMGRIENAPSRIFYLTPLKKNVQDVWTDIRKKFVKEKKIELFDANVLLMKRNAEAVIEHLLDSNPSDDFSKLESYRALRKKVEAYRRHIGEDGIVNEDAKDIAEQIENEYERKFRRDVELIVSKWKDARGYEKRLAKIKKEYPWLLDIYPAMLTKKRKVIITTVDKFFYGNNPIIDKHYRFVVNSITDRALIFIDESDSAKQRLLASMIEECTEYKLDLLRLVRNIHHAMNDDRVSSDLFKQLQTDNPDHTTKASFEKLKKVFQNVYDEHNLELQFKLDDTDSDQFFLFHDYSTMTIVDKKNGKMVSIKRNEARGLNLLSTSGDEENSFVKFIADIHGAINYFITFCNIAAKNYMAYKNNGEVLEKMEIEDSITTVLNCFNLAEPEIKTLVRIVINNFRTPKLDVKQGILNYDLYQDGFQYYGFENDTSHDINTRIELSFLNDTPEKFLLTLAKRAYVVCLSATADAQTVTGNFDIQYIRDNLGDSFYVLPKQKSDELKRFYETERSKPHRIDLNVFAIQDKTNPEASVFQGGYLEQFTAKIAPYSATEEPGENGKFRTNRFCRMAQAIRAFVKNRDAKVCLVVANMNLRTYSDNIYRFDNVQCVVDLTCREAGIAESEKPTIVSMASSDFESKKGEYLNLMRNGKRVILMTSYPTASTGQNLQYEMELDGEFKQFDIDTIYLENPRNLLTRINSNSEESDVLRFVYQTLALRSSGEIPPKRAAFIIENAFRNRGRSADDAFEDNSIYGTDSVNFHAVSFLKQAIGRINRTTNKGHTRIFLDGEIYEKVHFRGEETRLQTLDFLEVAKRSNPEVKPNSPYLKKLNRALTCCMATQSEINKLMNRTNGSWALVNMEAWNEIRDFVLKHPTISSDELGKHPEMRDLYLEASDENHSCICYYYARIDENRTEGFDRISYIQKPEERYIRFDSQMCGLDRLMAVPYIKQYFISNGYATEFTPNEFILIPNIMRNIYMGALGEAAGKCIFDGKIKRRIAEITDPAKFERFDFQLVENPDVFIDFKNWNRSSQVDGQSYETKCSEKLDSVGGKHLLVVNMFSNPDDKPYVSKVDKRIIVIPRLVLRNPRTGAYSTDNNMCAKIDDVLGRFLK